MKILNKEDSKILKNLEYEEFIDLMLEDLILLCNDIIIIKSTTNSLSEELVNHLENSNLSHDYKRVFAKMRNDKINIILNEKH